jgi:hypothetical protein
LLPINLLSTRAELLSPSIQVTDPIHREVTLGDPRPGGDERRCATIAALADAGVSEMGERFITNSAQAAYRHFYGVDYCSEIAAADP